MAAWVAANDQAIKLDRPSPQRSIHGSNGCGLKRADLP